MSVASQVLDWLVPDPVLATLPGWLALPQLPPPEALWALVWLLGVAWLLLRFLLLFTSALTALATRHLPPAWSDIVAGHEVLVRLAWVFPVLAVNGGLLLIPSLGAGFIDGAQRFTLASLAIVTARTIGAVIDAAHTFYQRHLGDERHPVKGYVQISKLLLYVATGYLAVAALADRSPWYFLSGLGALTAIFVVIFRDTLLSFVAGVQLVNNDLVRVGDWLQMPQFNADGEVIDIALNVVRVQNWDRTITSIPAHKFIEHAFTNWRGMFESGGRQILRSVYLDVATVRFLRQDEVERFSRFLLLKDYIREKQIEIEEWNAANVAPEGIGILANGRHMTNLGTLRAYILEYLRRHPRIDASSTLVVRQTEPTPHGVGLQLYAYARDTHLAAFERVQSDIFDHILAIVPEFELRLFQQPTGADLAGRRDVIT
ncbi:MAG: mechanosensitive ion channel family protein [Candidatus Sericytochromatia bacterium]|nr:mechanosensitive ion channel family protein [Candidatus Sericytochromatia bacterium]